jgi:nickel-dependent lactate racemase
MLFFKQASDNKILGFKDLRGLLYETLYKLGPRKKVLAIPPDNTRIHSRAGEITQMIYKFYGNNLADILPALGTHAPMTKPDIISMFGDIPHNLFRVHDWRNDVITLGTLPGEFLYDISDGKVNFPWKAQVNRLLRDGGHDLIISIGQVVPHEVAGMANFNKNIFIGTGGPNGINKSHFLGAVCDMETIMGKADNPVRSLLNEADRSFSHLLPKILYILTVIGNDDQGNQGVIGLFIGDDKVCFYEAAGLSMKKNITLLDKPLKKAVVYLDQSEFESTWLGNKAIYRTRMAMANNSELIILAPGVNTFGEDPEIDLLIRKYGYRGTKQTLDMVQKNKDLNNNLSAAAHLIHGSSENRFKITYCPGGLGREEIEKANFEFADIKNMLKKYPPEKLQMGINEISGEQIYYIPNPALGLWSEKKRFK